MNNTNKIINFNEYKNHRVFQVSQLFKSSKKNTKPLSILRLAAYALSIASGAIAGFLTGGFIPLCIGAFLGFGCSFMLDRGLSNQCS